MKSNDWKKAFAGKGVRKVKKELLNKTDVDSNILSLMLSIEEASISAKTNKRNSTKHYKRKENLILNLISIFDKKGMTYGFAESDIKEIESIIFFEFAKYQFSWHTHIDYRKYPKYTKIWDGRLSSTLGKLERIIQEKYEIN